MNGFTEKGLDEDNFGENKALSAVKAFDAFPKTKPSYQERTSTGGIWTVTLILASLFLTWSELARWWKGSTTHTFSVEQGIGHDLQINLDMVVMMNCEDLHVNVQDAAGDRILAGSVFQKDPTIWTRWDKKLKAHALGHDKQERLGEAGKDYKEEDVHNYLSVAHHSKRFPKTPKIPRGWTADSCRIYGTMHGNKVQGDFHITARGHGYLEFAEHLDHSKFNFSHRINELSFGPFYPSLENPLDNTFATTDINYYKFQYFLSVVPTVYTTDARALRLLDNNFVFTNQYAVTEQSRKVSENFVPGIFIKFDMEPIGLTIAEEWSSFPALFIRIVNVVSGLLVAGGWCYQLSEWAKEVWGRKSRRVDSFGMLNGNHHDVKHAL
ncbi:uncharacterized protein MYCFIDRAFT_25415 [Pseudocercospora fijiensis CIRAD86]|uniref:Endoplasmic reticulum-Golgi intermediate compartment protein n=1 Tax=Pseudocercospora fijiensis (strain CIRAD86) TaxID=383855 RepID=N1Q939_PSEFD|nr:uncharacterized protein MYCFIDRAFT_25415 [Pseudocercospora fijiensis CIRAD86]EME88301.1 hypothetical protein MYCFIDRAFT_25415 [Pseudocercospora fijiensis CIRAD86]